MTGLGAKLFTIRLERGLSLRQVAKQIEALAQKNGDPLGRVSPSWLNRIEKGCHKISAAALRSLEEVYHVPHEELLEYGAPKLDRDDISEAAMLGIPLSAREWLANHEGPLLPPQTWGLGIEQTTLLPDVPKLRNNGDQNHRRPNRTRNILNGVIGTKDKTLYPFVRPGAIVEIDTSLRSILTGETFPSVHERPIYFLHHREGYACGWCELDATGEFLTLIPSAVTSIPHRTWRYPADIEILGTVVRVFTRVGPMRIRTG